MKRPILILCLHWQGGRDAEGSHSRLISGPNRCVILADTYLFTLTRRARRGRAVNAQAFSLNTIQVFHTSHMNNACLPLFSAPIIQYFRSHSRLISGPNRCVILADTYSKEIRVNTWISLAIVCLLKDQVKTVIKLFFEIGTVVYP